MLERGKGEEVGSLGVGGGGGLKGGAPWKPNEISFSKTLSFVFCCAVLCCGVLWCAVLCCAVLCCAVLCCAVLCCAVLCCAVLCCAVLCCAEAVPHPRF